MLVWGLISTNVHPREGLFWHGRTPEAAQGAGVGGESWNRTNGDQQVGNRGISRITSDPVRVSDQGHPSNLTPLRHANPFLRASVLCIK